MKYTACTEEEENDAADDDDGNATSAFKTLIVNTNTTHINTNIFNSMDALSWSLWGITRKNNKHKTTAKENKETNKNWKHYRTLHRIFRLIYYIILYKYCIKNITEFKMRTSFASVFFPHSEKFMGIFDKFLNLSWVVNRFLLEPSQIAQIRWISIKIGQMQEFRPQSP